MSTVRCLAADMWRSVVGLLGHHRARQTTAAYLASWCGLDGHAALAAIHHALTADASAWTWPVLLVLVETRDAAILEYVTHLDTAIAKVRAATGTGHGRR